MSPSPKFRLSGGNARTSISKEEHSALIECYRQIAAHGYDSEQAKSARLRWRSAMSFKGVVSYGIT